MSEPTVAFDHGTAYDFFASLYVLHHPDEFNLRGAWAAGVRSRLPEEARELLADLYLIPATMSRWVHGLDHPKTARRALEALAAIPAEERLERLLGPKLWDPASEERLAAARRRGHWTTGEREWMLAQPQGAAGRPFRAFLIPFFDWWVAPDLFGHALLEALEAYYEAFFAEEEKRLAPVLEAAVVEGRGWAEREPVDALLERLSQGVRWSLPAGTERLVLVPVVWTTPILMIEGAEPPEQVILYGARPPEMGLVAGGTVPDLLLQALKALAEPTRLRILRYLASDPHSPSRLARRLRLRAPTVIHHLDRLRLARLVVVIIDDEGNRRYALRPEAVEATCAALETFLGGEEGEDQL